MTFSNTLKAASDAPVISPVASMKPSSASTNQDPGFKAILIGPNGLRAGWRLLIFSALVSVFLAIFLFFRFRTVQAFREANQHTGPVTLTPSLVSGSEIVTLIIVLAAAFIMSRIEHRKLSEYGLPFRQFMGKNLWIGLLAGFAAISATLLTIFLLHGFRITGLALHGATIFTAMGAWAIAFLLSALFEEFLIRGYVQYTLASGIGFWPAAFVMSGLFGFSHYFNAGETVAGAISAGSFGILLCLFLRRTGNLWMAIGFHTGWDWGQTFYGVPDSGLLSYHSVLSSSLHGPLWLTGGTVGPEATIFTPIALLIAGLIFSRFYRENHYQECKPRL
jgi:uncharacterized protein